MSREETSTARVETAFGAHYVHVSHIGGQVTGMAISSPGKFDNTEVGALLDKIAMVVREELRELRGVDREGNSSTGDGQGQGGEHGGGGQRVLHDPQSSAELSGGADAG